MGGEDEQEVSGGRAGWSSMVKEVLFVALRRWGASGKRGNRSLTTCRAVVLPRFGGPEVTSASDEMITVNVSVWWPLAFVL